MPICLYERVWEREREHILKQSQASARIMTTDDKFYTSDDGLFNIWCAFLYLQDSISADEGSFNPIEKVNWFLLLIKGVIARTWLFCFDDLTRLSTFRSCLPIWKTQSEKGSLSDPQTRVLCGSSWFRYSSFGGC